MSSIDIHSRGGGKRVRDLLGSCFATLLLGGTYNRPMYLVSPWLSDFRLFDNQFGEFRDLFTFRPDFGENPVILFSEALTEIANRIPIRIITWSNPTSRSFVDNFRNAERIQIKIEAAKKDHQKGLLSEQFYFEGSMNFTYSGVYKNAEKILCSPAYERDQVKMVVSDGHGFMNLAHGPTVVFVGPAEGHGKKLDLLLDLAIHVGVGEIALERSIAQHALVELLDNHFNGGRATEFVERCCRNRLRHGYSPCRVAEPSENGPSLSF